MRFRLVFILLAALAPLGSVVAGASSRPHDPTFALHEGDTLKATIDRWSVDSGYRLVWSTNTPFPNVSVTGNLPQGTTFNQALRVLLKAYWIQSYPIEGRVYASGAIQISDQPVR